MYVEVVLRCVRSAVTICEFVFFCLNAFLLVYLLAHCSVVEHFMGMILKPTNSHDYRDSNYIEPYAVGQA